MSTSATGTSARFVFEIAQRTAAIPGLADTIPHRFARAELPRPNVHGCDGRKGRLEFPEGATIDVDTVHRLLAGTFRINPDVITVHSV